MWQAHLPTAGWIDVNTPNLEAYVREMLDQPIIAIDTETTGKDDMMVDYPLFWSLSWGENRYCLPAYLLPLFTEVFNDPTKTWVLVNAKFDMHMLANVGIRLAGNVIDCCVMHALLYEERPHDLAYMEHEILGWVRKKGGFRQAIGMKKGETAGDALMRKYNTEFQWLVDYASTDAYSTFKIYLMLRKELEARRTWSLWPNLFTTLWDIFWKVEVPFTKVLWDCEREGVKIDSDYLLSRKGPIERDLTRLERDVWQVAAHDFPDRWTSRQFKARSDDMVREYFFQAKGYKPRKLTKGGKSGVRLPSVDEDALTYFSERGDRMAELLLEHRSLSTVHSNYIMGIPKRMDVHGRVHTRFNQDVARTGRLSSTNPNLMNIKRVEEDIYKFRGMVVADDGEELVCFDYDQLEMRLLAAAAGEEAMIQTFLDGRDIHISNAELIFGKKYGVTYDEIVAAKKADKLCGVEIQRVKEAHLSYEKEEEAIRQVESRYLTDRVKLCLFIRNASKTTGFGMNYGMGAYKLAARVGITLQEAQEIMDNYMMARPAVDKFFQESVDIAFETGFAFSALGKTRFLPEVRSENKKDASRAERQAGNHGIQGTAANAAQLAMLNIHRQNLKERFGCRMLLQVHDELVFQCPKETIQEVQPIIKECMEHPFPTDLGVPLTVSGGHGRSWMDAKG